MYDFGVVGGDIRQMYVAEYLVKAGYSVFCYGVENVDIHIAKNMQELAGKVKYLIAPVPFSKDGRNLYIKNSYKKMSLEEFAKILPEYSTVYGGAVSKSFYEYVKGRKIRVVDILRCECVEKMNTIATAEGTIAEAISCHPTYLYGSEILILGFGKCGSALAEKMAVLGGNVTVCVRRTEVKKMVENAGYKAISFEMLSHKICDFEYIFNTVPARVLDYEILKLVRKDAVIIDIASMPGGVDFEAAKRLKLNCRHCLGLPGKYCPCALARVYVEQILDNV